MTPLDEAVELIEQRLLAIGGEKVELTPQHRIRLALLGKGVFRTALDQLREWSTEGLTVVAGWPVSCPENTIPRWVNGEGDLVLGYALRSFDQTWWSNNWIGRPDGTILDSLPGHVAYFGKVCNDPSEWGSYLRKLLEMYQLAMTGKFMPKVRLYPAV